MARSIRVASECIARVKHALRCHGFPSQNALAVALGLSRSTITSFFTGKPVDYVNFVEISERLGLDWQAICHPARCAIALGYSSILVIVLIGIKSESSLSSNAMKSYFK